MSSNTLDEPEIDLDTDEGLSRLVDVYYQPFKELDLFPGTLDAVDSIPRIMPGISVAHLVSKLIPLNMYPARSCDHVVQSRADSFVFRRCHSQGCPLPLNTATYFLSFFLSFFHSSLFVRDIPSAWSLMTMLIYIPY